MSDRKTTDETYAAAAIATKLEALPRWRFADGTIQRSFATGGWPATLMVVNAIGHLCEAAWHHPDLEVSYDKVVVKLSTHSAKGITDKDFAMAARIEDVVAWRPGPEGSPLTGPPASKAILKPEG